MKSKTTNRFSLKVRARAVRLVLDPAYEQPSWAAVKLISTKIGY